MVTVDADIGELELPVMVASVFKLIWVKGAGTPTGGIDALTGTEVGVITVVEPVDETGVDKLEWCL